MQRLGPRRTLSAIAIAIIVAGCGSTPTSPFPPASASAPPPPSTPAATPASPSPNSTPGTVTPTAPVAEGRWQAAGALALGRASAHAVTLADGRVLIVGNDNICTPGGAWDDSVQAEVLDPPARTSKATGSLNAPRTDFVAVGLPDGRVLVVGGLTSASPAEGAFGSYSSTKLYDPKAGAWTASGLLNVARTEPTAALLPDGTVLVAGGAYVDATASRVLASAELYDPETGSWSETGSMTTARSGPRSTTLSDGRVLVVGGEGPSGDPLASAEIYDPSTGAWTAAGGMLAPRRDFVLAALPGGGALVAGGTVDGEVTAAADRFDPLDTGGTWVQVAAMPAPASNASATLLGDGRVFVAGGIGRVGSSDNPGTGPALVEASLYDPATATWSPAAPLAQPREGGTFVTLPDRTLLLVGGDAGYVGEPSTPWCPEPVAAAVRYVPGNLASFPPPVKQPATLARSNSPRATANPADARKASASITAFGLDLYRRMLADGTLDAKRNAVFSPTSVVVALGMARAGSKGATATQMDAVLHTPGWNALGPGLNALTQELESRNVAWKDPDGTARQQTLALANGTWAQAGWPIVQGYLDQVAATFGAGLRLVDYIRNPDGARRTINSWVKSKTGGRIPELLLAPDVTTDTRLYLVNAVYLKAMWEKWFEIEETASRTFTRLDGSRVSVPTMVGHFGFDTVAPYSRGSGWQATELRYMSPEGGKPLAMTLIMPTSLASFERGLTPARLASITAALDRERRGWEGGLACPSGWGMGGCYPYDLELSMPRFRIETRTVLNKVLASAGMPLAFQPEGADFAGIHVPRSSGDGIYISKVVHQANIDVDEKGTEAAAATAVGMSTGGGPSPLKTITLRLDHPFLFVLRDVATGAVLFMGRVVDPSATK